jgi:formylglycine-generating enzyme required for sulfatase activity
MTVTGAKGKADLLRLLATTQGLAGLRENPQGLADAHPLAAMLGLALREAPEDAVQILPALTAQASGTVGEVLPAKAARPPLQARFFAVLQASRPQTPEEPNPGFVNRRPLRAEDCAPRKNGSPPFVPLVGRSRLWPALYRSLACPRAGSVDLPVLVRKLASAQVPRRMPRRSVRNLGHELVVVVDRAHRLIPYNQDYTQLLRELRRLHGAVGITLWLVLESPDATLSVQKDRGPRQSATGGIPLPAAGTSVLILGDLGQLSSDPAAGPAWVDFCRRLKERGAHPVAWVPMSGRLVSAELTRYAQVHCLTTGDLRPVKGRKLARAALAAPLLETLSTRLACCVRVEPALLRSLRLMSPDTAMEPGLEALVWSHAPVVEAGYRFCEIGRQHQASYRAAFGRLGADEQGKAVQAEILRRMLAVHAHRGRSTESVEVLIWLAHAGAAVVPLDLANQVDEASEWFRRLGDVPEGVPGDVAGYSRDLLDRHGGDKAWVEGASEALAPLWVLSGSDAIPPGLKSVHIDAARRRMLPEQEEAYFSLVQRNDRLFLEPRESKSAREPDLWAPLQWPDVTVVGGFEWTRLDGAVRRWLTPGPGALELPLGEGVAKTSFHLVSGNQRYQIGLLPRPSWAAEWGMARGGLYAMAPSPLGGLVQLDWSPYDDELWEGPWPPSERAFRSTPVPIGQGMHLGADLQFGLYLDVSIGTVTQRFRYIEPGEFTMGSPDTAAGRNSNEGPQHVVVLTEGYWLADTACSQALWQAVMGENPSDFKNDPQNPVENVSWNDVDGFLRRLEALLLGVKVVLPTEAEWEYACRAGTKTAFSFGEAITPKQANYDGRQAFEGGATGEYRGKTVPVKTSAFAANPWGLYQMHGNVWEWCADGQRTYDGELQTNPRGPAGYSPRVLRGGSWDFDPRWLRSAYRDDDVRDWGSLNAGFRFSLRSTSPKGGAERLPEAQVAPEGARFVGRIDTSERSSYLDHVMDVISPSKDDKSGPVPWTALKETLPPPRSKRRKSKSGGKK